jgi:zinc protease
MSNLVMKTKLENGLTVHLKEIHTAPIISHWVWYRIGSRNEVQGKTGISHWVEHMQFKGTPRFPAGVLDKAISRDGGMWNAMTYLDWTTYFETMPADKAGLALQLEADRMANSLFETNEVESERTVIISEREGSENEPLFRLGEAVQSAAFKTHPYRNQVIGSIEDLHLIQRDDLYQHYRTNYTPSNAILAVAGDFDSREILQRIQDIFGSLPSSPVPYQPVQAEPPRPAEERLEVKGPGETAFLQMAYRAPAANQADFFPFILLDSLLTGPSSLSMFGGGGISNKTSRMYRALIERELAVSVNGSLQATIDPYLYEIIFTVHPDRSPGEVLAAADIEINRLQEKLITPEELARAVKQARALFAYSSENITNQAFWLGYSEIFATYDWFTHYMDELEKVTPEAVQRIAQTYLNPAHRVVGTYLPTGGDTPESEGASLDDENNPLTGGIEGGEA